MQVNPSSVSKSQRTYLPAAGHDVFLPLYDLIARLLGADQARQALLDQAHSGLEIVCLISAAELVLTPFC